MNDDPLAAAQAAHKKGDFVGAKKAYEAVVAADPHAVLAWQGLAHIAYQNKFWQAAVDYLQLALACDMSGDMRAQLLTYMGLSYQNLQELEQAEAAYQAAITADPTQTMAQYNMGTLYANQEKWQAAVAAYEKLLQQAPEFIKAWQNLATVYCALGDMEKSLTLLQKAYTLAPLDEGVGLLLAAMETWFGQQRLAANDLDMAKQYFLQAVMHNPSDSVAQYNLGVIAYQQQNWSLAEQRFHNVTLIDEHHFEAHYNLFVLYKKHGVLSAAREKLKYLHEQYPHNEMVKYLWASFTGYEPYTHTPKQFVRELFDSYAPHFDQDLLRTLNYQLPSLLDELLASTAMAWPVARALDLGCGTGLCGQLLRKRTHQLIGLDLSEGMLAEARKKNIYDQLVCADCVTVLAEHSLGQFDVIVAADIFGYFGDLTPIFSHIKANLTPQGIFVFSIENDKNHKTKRGFQLMDTGRFVHSEAYIRQLCSQYVFNVVVLNSVQLRDQRGKGVMGQVFLLTQV